MHPNFIPGRFAPRIAGIGVFALLTYSVLADNPSKIVRSIFPDPSGTVATTGTIDPNSPFFQSLGTNGRSCGTCHQASDAWSVTPDHIRDRFEETLGLDPIFRPNDGANCDTLDVSSLHAREMAYSLLLSKGLIRVALDVPATPEFTVVNVDNPYGCSSKSKLSMYRRPLPSTNLRFLSTVMWDGRESFPGNTLVQNLKHQSNDATTGHAQGAPISDAIQQQIVDFELGLHTAQLHDHRAGDLSANGGHGGPLALSTQPFQIGINDPLNPPFTPEAMDIFKNWLNLPPSPGGADAARRSIARGEQLFNTKPIAITGVAGLNDLLGVPTLAGTCTTCHNTPNVGNHSVPLAINIGVSDPSRRTPDLPLFTLENAATHVQMQTSDPGRAMVTGKWADIGKTKGPVLRALAARAPYFHNGSARNLDDVVDFYSKRFGVIFTLQEKRDLVNFLNSL